MYFQPSKANEAPFYGAKNRDGIGEGKEGRIIVARVKFLVGLITRDM